MLCLSPRQSEFEDIFGHPKRAGSGCELDIAISDAHRHHLLFVCFKKAPGGFGIFAIKFFQLGIGRGALLASSSRYCEMMG